MKQSKPSVRLWTMAAAVGVLSAVVMITGAAQEKPRETAGESEKPEVMPQEIVEVIPEPETVVIEQVATTGDSSAVEDFENEKIETALLDKASVLEDVKVTFYCCEKRKHICGTGDGLTASGTEVTPYVTVAVDPRVIPLGSQVMVDFGDGEIHYFIAEDVGGSVKGNHIDIAVEGHQEALELGVMTATVYFIEE